MPNIRDWMAFLGGFAPLSLAASWDNVGLLLGERDRSCGRVMTCLTVTPEVVAEAVVDGAQLIVSHHPILFKGVKNLSEVSPEGRLLAPLLKHGIAVFSPHTAFDNCPGGINDGLAMRFGLTNIRPLRPREGSAEFKLVVFIPDGATDRVAEAIFAAGGGCIGEYEQCSFRTPGTGTFFGNESTNPAVGERGRREAVAENRLEIVVPGEKLDAAITAMRASHPYEEPAFDVYALKAKPTGGEGRIGALPFAIPLSEFAARVKESCSATFAQFVGDEQKSIQIVALACGAAGEFLNDAIRAKADVFVTGELRFHDLLSAEAAGIGLVLPGHFATERPGIDDLAIRLQSAFPDCTVWASQREREPLRLV